MILTICTKQILSVMKLVKLIVLIIRIAAPLLLIIATMRDYAGAVKNADADELKQASHMFVKRLIATLLIFFLPSFVLLIARYSGGNLAEEISSCYGSASVWNKDDAEAFKVEDPIQTTSCNVTVNKNGTTYIVISGNNSGSNYKVYLGSKELTLSGSTIEVDGTYTDVKVGIVGNPNKVDCKLKAVYTYSPVNPPSGSNIVAEASSDTLIVKVRKVDNHYLSYIWVKDPYKQFNKEHASNYGTGRENLASILKRAVNKNGPGKIYLGTNASGFYVNGTWTPNSISYNNQYNFTQEGGLVITDGKVIRNWYYTNAVDRSRNDTIYGISPKGYLVTYPNINKYDENGRKELFQKIIDSGIRNTVTFRPILIQDGQIVGWKNDTYVNNTTAFCQIDRNNFILYSARSGVQKGKTVEELRQAGCKTAVNFDGGGSVSLFFKGKDSAIQTITGGDRTNVEILYVTE